jgi:hypothetical protein
MVYYFLFEIEMGGRVDPGEDKGAFGRAPAVVVLVEQIPWGAESVLGKRLAKQLLLVVSHG